MKKFFTLVALAGSALTFAQKTNTTNAAMAYKSYEQAKYTDAEQAAKDLIEAKTYIDLSAVHVDTKNDPKTLMYLGFIYVEIPICAAISGDATLKAIDPEQSVEKGFKAFEDSKANDPKKMYAEQIDEYCGFYRSQFANMGITSYEEGKYEEAMAGLMGAATFGEAMGLKDSAYYFYGGIAAFKLDNWKEAEEAFSKTVEWGYQTGSSVYYLSQSMLKQGKKDEVETMLKAQVAKNPKNKDIMIELINFYIDTDRKPEAVQILNDAIALDPNNPVLIYTAGTIYENMGDFANAETNYIKAQGLGDKNAGFALGSLYFNKGADLVTEANKLTFGTPEYQQKYDPMIEESKVYFNKALPFLEQAAVENPKDLIVLEALKQAYGKVGNTEKFLEIKKRIEEVKAGQ
ncbi:MAG: tetratricopeptide repeat protein [Bacteroidetes bacterium]|nr:tetratricopeptide repeat protein [Bacteroidota bacterium]